MDKKLAALYELYQACFPGCRTTEDWFFSLLRLDKSRVLWEWREGVLAGAAVVQGDSVTLLCVREGFRRQGLGSRLLAQAEGLIRQAGGSQVVLGEAEDYLFQGVPEESPGAVAFFQRRGYRAAWSSVNMRLDLAGYDPGQVKIPPAAEGVRWRMMEPRDRPALLEAVREAQPEWVRFYADCPSPILLAEAEGRIAGFEMLPPEGGRFLWGARKPGSVECVGVVPAQRRRGIGMAMVLEGVRWLRDQGCDSIELRYVALEDWYAKVGFRTYQRQWMGRKGL